MKKLVALAVLIWAVWWYASRHLALDSIMEYAHKHREASWSPGLVYTIATAYYGREDYGRAQKAFTQLIEDDPKGTHTGRAMLRLADSQRETRDYTGARETLNRFLEEFPDDSDRVMAQRRRDELPAQ